MKRLLIIPLTLIPLLALHAQDIDWKKYHKQFVRVDGNLYASKYEAGNLEYRAFLEYIKEQDDHELLQKTMVDTSQWANALKYYRPYSNYYFQHEAYNDYPVVNITREGTGLFCEWLTQTYNAYPKRKFEKVDFRLPTEEEWKEAARGGIQKAIFPWGGPYLRANTGEYLANFRRVPESTIRMDIGDSCFQYVPYHTIGKKKQTGELQEGSQSSDFPIVVAPVRSGKSYGFGMYHMAGNAAEMVHSDTRNTIGGAWNTTGYYLRIDADDPYAKVTGGHPAIGFRVFMEVIRE